MKPTIGRIVTYNTSAADREVMKQKLQNVQEKLPAVIVSVHGSEMVNLKVIMDGPGELWKTSVPPGESESCWQWPVIEN